MLSRIDRPVIVQIAETLACEIIVNLVDKGIRYRRPGSAVSVTLLRRPGQIALTVTFHVPGV